MDAGTAGLVGAGIGAAAGLAGAVVTVFAQSWQGRTSRLQEAYGRLLAACATYGIAHAQATAVAGPRPYPFREALELHAANGQVLLVANRAVEGAAERLVRYAIEQFPAELGTPKAERLDALLDECVDAMRRHLRRRSLGLTSRRPSPGSDR